MQQIICPQKWGTNLTTEVAADDLGGGQMPRNGWILLGGMRYRTLGFEGTIMRHFFGLLLTVATLPGSVMQLTLPAFLVTLRSSAPGFLMRW